MLLLHSAIAFSLLLAALFSLGETFGFLLAAHRLLGREKVVCQLLGAAWSPEAWVQLSSGRLRSHPPFTRASDSQEGASCQVTCRGQQEPEASASPLT